MEIRERFYVEVNENNSVLEDGYLTITIPYEVQSGEGVDLYFSKELVEKNLLARSVEISPAPLERFWNWTCSKWGNNEYENEVDIPLDLSQFNENGKTGSFGFSGYTHDESEITVEIELVED